MAQPNVVREPSMDEILASIRRIIESNDPVPQPGIATGRAEPEGFNGRPANDDVEEVTLTVDDKFAVVDDEEDAYADLVSHAANVSRFAAVTPAARQSEEQQASEVVTDQPAPVQPRSLSLADVAARVRAASERGAVQREAPIQQIPAEEPRAAIAVKPDPVESAFDAEPEPVVQNARQPEIVEEVAVEQTAQPLSLLSSSAGEQVARSFENLALAVDDAERRSFDQMAEEMLRPMLQEWLDDNLPKLVERLVREEIERVARGARR